MKHAEARVVAHLLATASELREQGVLLRTYEIVKERAHRSTPHREVAEREPALIGRTGVAGAVAPADGPRSDRRAEHGALDDLKS